MENKNEILNQLKRGKSPLVPDGFFDRFVDDLMNKINEDTGILGQLKKAKRPSIPDNYFDQLLTDLPSKEDKSLLEGLEKTSQPVLPEGYFDDFQERLLNAIPINETTKKNKGKIIPLKVIAIVASVAALLTLLFNVVDFSSNNDPIKTNTIVGVDIDDQEDEYDTYLTYLDEDEIIDFIIENDIELDDTTDAIEYEDYYDYSEEDIEDYYLELL